MKRKMIGIMTSYVSGLFFVSFFTSAWQLIIPAVSFLIYIIIGRLENFSVKDFAIVSMSFAVAFTSGELYTHYVYENIISYSDVQGNFSGNVSDYDVYDNDKARYIIKGKINNTQKAEILFYTNELDAVYGDRINIKNCTFRKISDNYLFDSEKYYKSDGIFLSAEKEENITVDKLDSYKIKNFLMNYKEKIISDFRISLGDDCGGFLSGMVFGEKSFIDDNIKSILYKTGIGHIMAVSGIHISVMAMFIIKLLKRFRVNRFVAFGLVNIFMAIMIIMANAPISAVRASIMFDIAYSAELFRRKNDTFNSLSVAVLLICIVNPYVIYSHSFLLSVSGTFGIGVFAPYMVENLSSDTFKKRAIRGFIMASCATVAIMPVSMLLFDDISIISPITNILIVPLCTFCMIIGMIYTFTGGFIPLLYSAGGIIKIILLICEKLSELRFSYISCGNDFTAKLAVIGLSIVVMVRISTGNRRYISLAIVFSMILTYSGTEFYKYSEYNKFKVAVLGKGSKSSVAVSYHNKNYIIDLDDYRNPRYISKYLSENSIDNVECIILHGNIQSLYPVYLNELNSVTINNWLAYGSIIPCENKNAVMFDDSYKIESDDYSITYSDNILRIVYENSEITFVSTKNNIPANRGLTVFYDRIVKDTIMQCDGKSIYLDNKKDIDYKYCGINNFCIEVMKDNNFKISCME